MFSRQRLVHLPLALALASAFAAPAAAQGGTWSDEFDRPGLLGRIFAVSEYANEVVAGGLGVEADGQEFGLVARFDGQRWRALGQGIHGFVVEDFALYQGELIAAGNFHTAGGMGLKSIARWDGSQWFPLGGGIGSSFAAQGTVFSLAVYQGELYAAGMFDRAGSAVVANIARWDGSQWRTVGSGFDGDVYALEAGGDGKLYAGGAFAHAGGIPASNIAAWDGTGWSAVGPGIGVPYNSPVRALEWHASKLWAGGYFDIPGGQLHEKLASWNGTAWQGAGSFPDSAISVAIHALQSIGTDLYVGGNIVSVDGIGVDRIARLSGTTWNSIGGLRGYSQMTVALALAARNGELLVGGNFTNAGLTLAPVDRVVSHSVVGFDGASWKQIGRGLGMDEAVVGGLAWNGGIVAVGVFQEAGRSVVSSVAFFDGVDWSRLGVFDAPVYDVCVFQNELVVAGAFTSVNGASMPGVAAFTGAAWHGFGTGGFGGGYGAQAVAVYQNKLYAGTIGGVQLWNGTAWQAFAPQIFGSIGDLHVHNNVLYIAGLFTVMGGHIASWDGFTQQIVGGGMDSDVSTLSSFGGELLAGGGFTQAGGNPASRLARWNGSSWSAFPGITGASVTALTVLRGELYAGGNPLLYTPAPQYMARWDGAQWRTLGIGPNGPPAELIADDAAGKLYVGGSFQDTDGRPSWNFGLWIPDQTAAGVPYCTAGTTSHGCTAQISGSGLPSASAPTGFTLSVSAMEGNKAGLFFYGVSGRAALPWGGGTSFLCVQPPTQRLPAQHAGGTNGACNGSFGVDWNAWRNSHPNGLGAPFAPGQTVWAQAWFRDPGAPANTNFSNGLEFTVTP